MTKEEIRDRIKYLKEEQSRLEALRDKDDTYQMGVKINRGLAL